MSKTMVLHDLEEGEKILTRIPGAVVAFAAKPKVRHCIGCFNCWLKTPGRCIISDRCQITPAMLADSDELIIISRLLYGGYAPEIKAVLDRSIGYLLPFFRIIHGEMHHTMRYQNPFKLSVYFYGDTSDQTECAMAGELVAANAINLGAGSTQVTFCKSFVELAEVVG